MVEKGGLPLVNHLLQHTLRSLCADQSQWVYSVFWRILPRNYPPPKWDSEAGILDRNKGNKRNWILVWEDGFCDFAACVRHARDLKAGNRCHLSNSEEENGTLQPELFFKMSHDVYNYGEGLMGKVAADNSHKWIYRDPPEHELAFLSPWQGSLDPHPRTWEAQFKAGIQTIAVVAVGEGLLQLGSTKKVIEDLNFVILLQRKFNYLQGIPGVFAPHPMPDFGMMKKGTSQRLMSKEHHTLSITADDQQQEAATCWQPRKDRNQILPQSTSCTLPSTGAAAGCGEARQLSSCSLSFPQLSNQQENQILGMKRPLESCDLPLLSSYKLPSPFVAPGAITNPFNNLPFPPLRNLNQDLLANVYSPLGCHSPHLPPSISSLHTLLSKLPSVTPPETPFNAPSSSPCLNAGAANPQSFTISPADAQILQIKDAGSAGLMSSVQLGSLARPLLSTALYSAGVACNNNKNNCCLEDACGPRAAAAMESSLQQASRRAPPSDSKAAAQMQESCPQSTTEQQVMRAAKDKVQGSSLLETFDNLSDQFRISEELENGDAYTSLLREMIR